MCRLPTRAAPDRPALFEQRKESVLDERVVFADQLVPGVRIYRP